MLRPLWACPRTATAALLALPYAPPDCCHRASRPPTPYLHSVGDVPRLRRRIPSRLNVRYPQAMPRSRPSRLAGTTRSYRPRKRRPTESSPVSRSPVVVSLSLPCGTEKLAGNRHYSLRCRLDSSEKLER